MRTNWDKSGKQAQKKLRSQYLLGGLYNQTEEQIQEEIREKEGWYFALVYRFFHNLTPVWAALISAFLTTQAISILTMIIFGWLIHAVFLQSLVNLCNWVLFTFLLFHNKEKFAFYRTNSPNGGVGIGASSFGTVDGKPTETFLKTGSYNIYLF